jgi:hypothetical protein
VQDAARVVRFDVHDSGAGLVLEEPFRILKGAERTVVQDGDGHAVETRPIRAIEAHRRVGWNGLALCKSAFRRCGVPGGGAAREEDHENEKDRLVFHGTILRYSWG